MQEPPIDPMEDTSPSMVLPAVQESRQGGPLGWILLLGAAVLTLVAAGVLLMPEAPPTEPEIGAQATHTHTTQPPTTAPTEPESESQPTQTDAPQEPRQSVLTIPTISSEQLVALLQTPVNVSDAPRPQYDPYTTIPERARTEFIDYVVTQGDTMGDIATRYGIDPASIAWCNGKISYDIVPGERLRIPPVDGACVQILRTRNQTIADVADEYSINDPYAIIDFPGNNLYGRSPEDVLLGGQTIFLPGGQGVLIAWEAASVEENSDGSYTVSFAAGDPGSCGAVSAAGGTAWANPLPNGTWVRGFFTGHSGVDISAATGTPIYAANGGPVLFSGTSRVGYGIAVVLGHGPYSTLYGHMSQRNVDCGQVVSTGQVVGLVGSTGVSSGPHLHFEIQYNGVAQDPTLTIGF